MSQTLIPRRVLIAELDSIIQCEAYGEGIPPALVSARYVGMIRTALVLSEQLLITDSMLLDGTFFAQYSPFELALLLGAPPHKLPLTVLSSHSKLANSLEAKRENATFLWQLRASGLSDQEISNHWARWVQASESGAIAIETYSVDVHGPPAGSRFLLSDLPDVVRGFSPNLQILAEKSLLMASRSGLLRLIQEEQSILSENAEDLSFIKSWWNQSYLDALAIRNKADWMRFAIDGLPESFSSGGSASTFHISGALRTKLEQISPALFGVIVNAVEPYRSAFYSHPSNGHMRNLTFATMNTVVSPSRSTTLRNAIVRASFAVVAIVFAIPDMRFGFTDQVGFTWVAFALACITTVPYGALGSLIQIYRAPSDAQINLLGLKVSK